VSRFGEFSWRRAAAAYTYARDGRMLARHIGRQISWYRALVGERAKLPAELEAGVPELF